MTTLDIELALPADWSRSLALPVEIRKFNLSLVKRALSSAAVEVEPGDYYATALLPNGIRLFGQSKIEGKRGKIVLAPEIEDESYLAFFGPSADVYKETLSDPIAYASQSKVLVRQFVGNVLTGTLQLAADDTDNDISLTAPRYFRGAFYNTLLQLVQPDARPLNVVLPVYVGESCEVSLRHTRHGMSFAITLSDPLADLLLRYLERGCLHEVATIVESETLNLRELLAGGNISTAALKGYAQLRLGELDELSVMFGELWSEQSIRYPTAFPDGCVIRAELLARLGRHPEALRAFCELPMRGLPFFKDGLSYATERLKLYLQRGENSFEPETLAIAAAALTALKRFHAYSSSSEPLFTYTGINISVPDSLPFIREEPLKSSPTWSVSDSSLPSAAPTTTLGACIAIDFGTTNSVVSVMVDDEPVIVPSAAGEWATPTMVLFEQDGSRVVGRKAKRNAIFNPENTVYSIKRFLGRRLDEVKEWAEVPYGLAAAANGDVRILAGGRDWSPPELAAMVLQNLKQSAENYLGQEVTRLVITVPAYFNDAQRQATRDAASIAGLEVVRMVNEQSAAALAFALENKELNRIAVFDFGGGNLNISIFEVLEGLIEVVATSGDTLGGDDIDQRLAEWITEKFKRDQSIDLSQDKQALQRVREAAAMAKIELSSTTETQIDLPFIAADAAGPKHLSLTLTRSHFEELINGILGRVRATIARALTDADVDRKPVDELLLVGGSTRIPRVEELVTTLFGITPNRSNQSHQVVPLGAALMTAVVAGERPDMLLRDVTPLSVGIETLGGIFTKLIERNSTIPLRKSEIFSTATDNQTSVEVHVLQGERPLAADNRSLGKFHLLGIQPAPRGLPQIEVSFEIDANGIVNVSAKDMATGREQEIVITSSSRLSKDEIDRMIKDAAAHSAHDLRAHAEIEERNRLEALVHSVDGTLRKYQLRVGRELRSWIESALSEAQIILSSRQTERQKEAIETLTNASHILAQSIYTAEDVAFERTAEGSAESAEKSSVAGAEESDVDS